MDALIAHRLVALEPDAAKRTGRLFGVGNDRRGSQIRTAFETALTKAGITGFRFHDLRHTYASHMAMSGATLKDVQELLGHSDLRMTNRYADLSPAHLRETVQRVRFGRPAPAVLPEPASAGPIDGPMVRSATMQQP